MKLSDYGDLCATQIYQLDHNVLSFMYYYDIIHETIIELNKDPDLAIRYHRYVSIRGENKSDKLNSVWLGLSDIQRLCDFETDNTKHQIFTYENSFQGIDFFSRSFKYGKKEIELGFNKDSSCVFIPSSNTCIVYKNQSGLINYNEKQETIKFFPEGFFTQYHQNGNEMECNVDSAVLEYKYMIKKKESEDIACRLLKFCPTIIKSQSTDPITKEFITRTYELSYDEFGIVDYCKLQNSDRYFSRYEFYTNPHSTDLEILSCHPHLLDPFNYRFIDSPLKYWRMDHVISSNGQLTVERKIYKIRETEIFNLINDLSVNQSIPFLDFDDEKQVGL